MNKAETELEQAIAERFKILDPVPAPRLAEGRKRFLTEAARMEYASNKRHRSFIVQPALAFAALALAAIIMGGALFTRISAAPTVLPTLTATPTRITTRPYPLSPSASTLIRLGESSAPAPAPVPEPTRMELSAQSLLSLISEERLTLCWKL